MKRTIITAVFLFILAATLMAAQVNQIPFTHEAPQTFDSTLLFGTDGSAPSLQEVSEEGLVLSMNFNTENVGGSSGAETILDSSIYNNHGTGQGTSVFANTDSLNGSYYWLGDGASPATSQIEIPDSVTINPVGDVTMSVWVSRDSLTGLNTVGGMGNVSADDVPYYIDMNGTALRWQVGDMVTSYEQYTWSSMVVDTWYLITITSEGTIATLYIDGEAVDTGTTAPSTGLGTFACAIGGRSQTLSGLYSWNGKLDDFRVYNRALSVSEIKALYVQKAEVKNAYVSQKNLTFDSSGDATMTGDLDVTGAVVGTSLDINGAADISGNLTGVDALTASGAITGAALVGTSLDMNGTVAIDADVAGYAVIIRNDTATSVNTRNGLQIMSGDDDTATNNSTFIDFRTNAGDSLGSIYGIGDSSEVVVFDGDITGTSDMRVKENIQYLTTGTETINALNPFSFTYKDSIGKFKAKVGDSFTVVNQSGTTHTVSINMQDGNAILIFDGMSLIGTSTPLFYGVEREHVSNVYSTNTVWTTQTVQVADASTTITTDTITVDMLTSTTESVSTPVYEHTIIVPLDSKPYSVVDPFGTTHTISMTHGPDMVFDNTTFTLLNKPYHKTQLGLSAQELERVVPSLVVTKTTRDTITRLDGTVGSYEYEVKQVKYVSLVPVLIQAVKETNARLDKVEDEIAALKALITP